MSESQLEQICDSVQEEWNIRLVKGEPKVIYHEAIRRSAEAEGKYIRQTGGRGNYGHCKIRLNPRTAGSGYEFLNEIRNGAIPEEFIEPINHGIREALEAGVLAGYPMVDLTASLYDGSWHETDSNAMAFRIAGSMAAKEAARRASPVLLEPVMSVEMNVPEEFLGTILHDLNQRRGRIESMEGRAGWRAMRAAVPLAELLGYARKMPESPRGKVESSVRFARYEPAARRDGDEGEQPGVTASLPGGPRPRIDFAAAGLEAEWE
jgi:elongation factor G